MEAMQLPVLPMNLAKKEVVEEPDVGIVEQTLQAEQLAVQLMWVQDREMSDHYKQQLAQEQQKDLDCGLEVQEVVVEHLASKIWGEVSDFLQDLQNGGALDYPEHAAHAQHIGQKFELFGEYLEGFQA